MAVPVLRSALRWTGPSLQLQFDIRRNCRAGFLSGSGEFPQSTQSVELKDYLFMPAGAYKRLMRACLLANLAGLALLSMSCGGGAGMPVNTPEPVTPTKIALSTSSLSFGNQPVAILSAPEAITLTNTGSSNLAKITGIAIRGADATSFTPSNGCGSTVAPGDSCKIAILFKPKASGAEVASLTLTDNATDSPQTVGLSGTGMHDVVLTWTPSASSGIGGYIILRSTGARPSAKPLFLTPIPGTTYADTNVKTNLKYQYWVITISSNGIIESPDSPGASATVPSP